MLNKYVQAKVRKFSEKGIIFSTEAQMYANFFQFHQKLQLYINMF